MEVALVNLSAVFCVQSPPGDSSSSAPSWRTLHAIDWDDVNMLLISSSGGSGTARVDFCKDRSTVDIHLCHIDEGCDTTSYKRFNVSTGRHLRRLASNKHSDITGFVVHPQSGRLQCVTHEYKRPAIKCLESNIDKSKVNAALRRDISFLSDTFSDGAVSIISRTLSDDVWIVYVEGNKGVEFCKGSPSGYFVFDRHEQELKTNMKSGTPTLTPPSLQLVTTPRPGLSCHTLGEMRPVHITAHDGEDLLCYLSTPPDYKPSGSSGRSGPLVVLVHGGPQAQDTWGLSSCLSTSLQPGDECPAGELQRQHRDGHSIHAAGDGRKISHHHAA